MIGAGNRGTAYAELASAAPNHATIAGVAEPREFFRRRLADRHGIPAARVFADWREAAAPERFADVAVIATNDRFHAEPAIAFARKGYHVLLEKPMAPNEPDCRRIVAAAKESGVILAVCHVLRYRDDTRAAKRILEEGRIGDVLCVQHLESVGHWHQAHSFVRGNTRNEKESSPMLLAKSCHDIDLIRHLAGVKCLRVASYGALTHFRKENQPAGAASRCLDCGVESICPYSAKRLYLGMIERGAREWPVDMLTPDLTVEGVTEALRSGPYGRCVYECDNDVVDHQVVAMEFEKEITATFTMTVGRSERKTRVFGTHGQLEMGGGAAVTYDWLTGGKHVTDTRVDSETLVSGHGGADYRLIENFVAAIANNDPGRILTGPEETLETHRMVFAAERARKEKRMVEMREMEQACSAQT